EKIIQVPFEMPPTDRVALHSTLFNRLNEVLSETPEGLFDQTYWTNVFYDGIDELFKVPRDVIRFANTLSVTYPSVAGEVNPVDFVAIEALRVFLPNVYDVIRSNPEEFSGVRSDSSYGANNNDARQAFHHEWQQAIPQRLRASTTA